MDQGKALVTPPSESLQDTVNDFNEFFQEKITKIRQNFNQSSVENVNTNRNESYVTTKLSKFTPTTVEEIYTVLNETVTKTSTLDPIPANLMTEQQEILIPHLCNIVNLSLKTGSIEGVKEAHITPLIKGLGLDSSEKKNYRPISNLSFIGKLIERIVLKRLNFHMVSNNLDIPNQSGYKKHHSTETLLVRIVNDLLIATNDNKATVVLMLDLSAAFDTVDHNLLLNILRDDIGITGTAFQWFKSFISGRCQRVKIGDHESVEINIKFGVPQGSVLGPVLFNIYIRSIYRSVERMKFLIQGYADDHQVYNHFDKSSEYDMLVNEVPKCFKHISSWMSQHYLQLNPGKTEIIVFGSPSVLASLNIHGVFLGDGICIRLSPVVKNLGFRLDSSLTFSDQVMKLKQSCFHKLRNIAKMKKFLTENQMKILIQAVILSKLDYCNALYFGCQQSLINKLQVIQNRACRVVFGLSKRDSVNDKLKEMHWLKVKERIEFKFLLLVYKSLNRLAPSYLSELLIFNNESGCRRRSLHVTDPYSSKNRAFQNAAPALWNRLPTTIKNSSSVQCFKNSLKTYMFKRSHNI